MKKIKFTLAAIAITAGIGGAFAFSSSPAPRVSQTSYYYFDAGSGVSLGQRTPAQQQTSCGTAGATDCAYGYTSVDSNGQPVGSPVSTIKKLP